MGVRGGGTKSSSNNKRNPTRHKKRLSTTTTRNNNNEEKKQKSCMSFCRRGKTLTTFLAFVVISFAFLNIWIGSNNNSSHNNHQSDDSQNNPATTSTNLKQQKLPLLEEFIRDATSSSTTTTTTTTTTTSQKQQSSQHNKNNVTKPGLEKIIQQQERLNLRRKQQQQQQQPVQQILDDSSGGVATNNNNLQNTTTIVIDNNNNDDVKTSTSTKPWSNVTTMGFYEARLFAGFRNQIMTFTMVVLEAIRDNCDQILLNTIPQKDTYGSNKNIPFTKLWDVPYWNTHYPQLPRLVDYDPVLFDQFNPDTRKWYRHLDGNWTDRNNITTYDKPSRPKPFGKQHQLVAAYMRYAKGNGPYASINGGHRHPSEILMLQGAMRPHPILRQIIDEKLHSLVEGGGNGNDNNNNKIEYITLHARVEPDMQRQMVCVPKKVLNLTDIFNWIEEKWIEPPAKHIFMPINREYLEQEGSDEVIEKKQQQLNNNKKTKPINWIAVENLRALNKARDYGLWDGQVKVFEFGSKALVDIPYYKERPSTTGSLINFFIGIDAKIFIGTEVSSYSHDLLATRFYRHKFENYYYLPDGLHPWTPSGTIDPPGFAC